MQELVQLFVPVLMAVALIGITWWLTYFLGGENTKRFYCRFWNKHTFKDGTCIFCGKEKQGRSKEI